MRVNIEWNDLQDIYIFVFRGTPFKLHLGKGPELAWNFIGEQNVCGAAAVAVSLADITDSQWTNWQRAAAVASHALSISILLCFRV